MKTLPVTGVTFKTGNSLLQKLFDSAVDKLSKNILNYEGDDILHEGAGYNKVFLESQAMGGEMYAKFNMQIALNNQMIFMKHQRPDGKIPGTVEYGETSTPKFNKTQGLFFAEPALNMYYWMGGEDQEYLHKLYNCLKKYDEYLWSCRDSNGDGILEVWCFGDTGEDHAVRYGNAPQWWEPDFAPDMFDTVPVQSMDITSYSYSCRITLAKISSILQNGEENYWRALAQEVADRIREYLWDDERGACFDRNKYGDVMPALIHNNLRCMFWGSFSQEMADRFVMEHLCNPEEFWTPMPLPSVALNDPIFRNIPTNNWSGQPEGLTYQRAIRALENYGYDHLIPKLGWALFNAIGENCRFAQQYDVYTARPSCEEGCVDANGVPGLGIDGYSPVMSATLEYMSRMFGVHVNGNELWWGVYGGDETEYTLTWGQRVLNLRCDGSKGIAQLNGRTLFEQEAGWKVVTDYEGNILRKTSIR